MEFSLSSDIPHSLGLPTEADLEEAGSVLPGRGVYQCSSYFIKTLSVNLKQHCRSWIGKVLRSSKWARERSSPGPQDAGPDSAIGDGRSFPVICCSGHGLPKSTLASWCESYTAAPESISK